MADYEDITFTQEEIESANTGESNLSDEGQEILSQEIHDEIEFGNRPVQTFLESAANTASFGITDKGISLLGEEFEKGLRERRERHRGAAGLGVGVGIIGPAVLSAGSSLLGSAGAAGKAGLAIGKAAKGAGAGMAAAAKVGKYGEKLTTAAMNKLIKDSGSKTFAKEVLRKGIAKGAGSAVEGSLYGVGHLISEEALGRAEFNAENLMAYGGQGALFGGVAGGLFGITPTIYKHGKEIVVPKIKGNKIVGFANKKIKNFKDYLLNPEYAAMKLSGASHKKISETITKNPELAANLPNVLKDIMKKDLKSLVSNNKLFDSVTNYVKQTGKKIDHTLRSISYKAPLESFPTKSSMSFAVQNRLEKLKSKLNLVDDAGKPRPGTGISDDIKLIDKEIKEWSKHNLDDTYYDASALNKEKQVYQQRANYERRGEIPLREKVAREVSSAFREEVLGFAAKTDDALYGQLKQEFLDFGTATKFLESFSEKVNQPSTKVWDVSKDLFTAAIAGSMFDLLGPVGAGLALKTFAKSDLKQKMIILTQIEKASFKVPDFISQSVKSYMKKGKKLKGVAVPSTVKLLIDSPLAKTPDKPLTKPKDDPEALENMTANLDRLKSDPTALYGSMSNRFFSLMAPKTYGASGEVFRRAVEFLSSKVPRNSMPVNPFSKRTYQPSEQEMYKFKKYLEAVQNPLVVMQHLKRGQISREGVEAISFVYPELYVEMQGNVFKQLDKKVEVDYEQRLQLGILMGIPTDRALEPEAIGDFQRYYKEAQVSQAGGTISASAAKQMDLSQSQATEIEKVSNRKDLKRS